MRWETPKQYREREYAELRDSVTKSVRGSTRTAASNGDGYGLPLPREWGNRYVNQPTPSNMLVVSPTLPSGVLSTSVAFRLGETL